MHLSIICLSVIVEAVGGPDLGKRTSKRDAEKNRSEFRGKHVTQGHGAEKTVLQGPSSVVNLAYLPVGQGSLLDSLLRAPNSTP